jgi:hypothetical protein
MENNAENRRFIARMCVESMTLEEMHDALIYEMRTRYKHEPGLFDTVVQELKDIDMLEGGE